MKLLTATGIAACLTASIVLQADAARAGDVRFNRDIRPILSDRCFHCHGPDEEVRQANLRLDRPDGADGSHRTDAGVTVIQPGSPSDSELWLRISADDPDLRMPPPDDHKQPLTDSEQELIRQWIEQGAEYEDFWAFVPPTMPDIPDNVDGAPIDRFVRARLQDEELTPAPPADKRTLIRRLTFDLTGLPPTREEIREFLADDSPSAWESLVDRLLASPHYGEHQARYWLDLVRFADTNGIHHDHYRDLSPYRDWVIRAFNENLPYDEFTRYQLAGDLYPEPSQDQLVASGFHRLHLIIDRGTALPEESHTRNVLDRVTSVGTAFMGLTVQCAVCHDHKYDPLTTHDFYSLYAFFNNIDAEPETGPRRGTDFLRGLQPPYIDLPDEQQAQALSDLQAQIRTAEADVARLRTAVQQEDDGSQQKQELREQLQQAEQRLKSAQKSRDDLLLKIPAAMVMKERAEPRPAHVLIRGAYDNPGDQVSRNTPAFLPPLETANDPASRMDLANWLVDPEHPLTARVAVNRFWQQLFGVGIVRTSEDFGAQGEWPTHPDLLDYLAVRFVDAGWNVKAVLKEIVMSDTYRQSSAASPEDFRRDPDNRLLARGSRYRMDAEMIRDLILATSGLLNPDMYGPSVKPPQPDGLWKSVGMPSSYPAEFTPDTGDAIWRRSLYTFWKRGMPPPQMTILNAPTREECIARRERTNTPLQALLLLNEPQYLKAARHLAQQHLADAEQTAADRVNVIYETITAQLPSEVTQAAFLELIDDLRVRYGESPELTDRLLGDNDPPDGTTRADWAAWTLFTSAVYNLDVTRTRQ